MSTDLSNRLGASARRVLQRCDKLAQCSDENGQLCRLFLTPAMREAHSLVSEWMSDAGLLPRMDDVGNITGVGQSDGPRILIGSHLDTVNNAGRYDGALGVILGIETASLLREHLPGVRIDVVGFSEEEGVRYACPYIGSQGYVGSFDLSNLDRVDDQGVSMRDAISSFGLDPDGISKKPDLSDIRAYLEVHIEQGPALASGCHSLAAVSSIVGQTRLRLTFTGMSQHAGTCPMNLRQDALVGAAEWISAVETQANKEAGLVATVGQIACSPNASNVVPGEVTCSLDLRHGDDAVRLSSTQTLLDTAQEISKRRGLDLAVHEDMVRASVPMNETLTTLIDESLRSIGEEGPVMCSGAGHDAAVMAVAVPTGLMFVRSPNGVSHHPDEVVLEGDILLALKALTEVVQRISAMG